MAFRTKRELVTAVLKDLRIVGHGQSVSADDLAEVGGTYDEVHAELRDTGLCYWPNSANVDTAEIPLAVFRGVSAIVASDVSDIYGKEAPSYQENDGQVLQGRVWGMRRVRAHMAKKPSGEPTPFSSY